MNELYAALHQEPWCFSAEQVAALTDWQVVNLFLKPAAERAERLRAETGQRAQSPPQPGVAPAAGPPRPARAPSTAPDYEPGTPGHRRQIVEQAFMGVMGLKREKAEALYEKQLQQWRDEQAGLARDQGG